METLEQNIAKRQRMLLKAYSDPDIQAGLVEQAKADIVFFFKYFLWTFNPREAPYHFPFIPYPVQEQAIRWVEQDIRGKAGTVCEKSRDTGATYIYIGAFLYFFLFEEFEGLLLSMRQTDVDNPTPSSLFGKLRYMADRLPFWMLPRKWDRRRNGAAFLRFTNPDNGNSIIGQATTEDAGRSGRKTAVLCDEFAFVSNRLAEGLYRSLQHVSDSCHFVSTPRGINYFKQLRDRRISRIITLHWTQIPTKCEGLYYIDHTGERQACQDLPYERRSQYGQLLDDAGELVYFTDREGRRHNYQLRSAWYDATAKASISPRDIAQEVDIKYLGSGYIAFDAEMIGEKSKQVRDGRRGTLTEENGKIEFREAKEGEEYEIEVWTFPSEPHYQRRTVIAADTAEGLTKGDYSSADVLVRDIDGAHAHLAASLHGHFKPDAFAEKLDRLGRWYDGGHTWLMVERNKDGTGVILNLQNLHGYTNLFHEDQEKEKLGYQTTDVKKTLFIQALDKALRDGELDVWSLNHFTEMSMYENTNGKLGATGNNHDDRVISLALAWLLVTRLGKPSPVMQRTAAVKRITRTSELIKRY